MNPGSTVGCTDRMLSELLSCNTDRECRLAAIRRILADRGVAKPLEGIEVNYCYTN